jgi:hypothetical protein
MIKLVEISGLNIRFTGERAAKGRRHRAAVTRVSIACCTA